MYWFGRAPLLRWVAAGLLVFGAVLVEFKPSHLVQHPFVAEAVEAGSPLEVEWREIPQGLFPVPELEGAVATHPITAGEPITPSDVTTAGSVPPGWWQLALEVSFPLVPGADAQVVLTESARSVPAVVVRMGSADPFATSGPVALIAVPAEDAALVAQAVASRRFVVLAGS